MQCCAGDEGGGEGVQRRWRPHRPVDRRVRGFARAVSSKNDCLPSPMASHAPESTIPGDTAFTRIGASSTAKASTRNDTAPFVVDMIDSPGAGFQAATPEKEQQRSHLRRWAHRNAWPNRIADHFCVERFSDIGDVELTYRSVGMIGGQTHDVIDRSDSCSSCGDGFLVAQIPQSGRWLDHPAQTQPVPRHPADARRARRFLRCR